MVACRELPEGAHAAYGFQFEFFCDKCGNGHMSPFIASKVGVATGILRAAGSF